MKLPPIDTGDLEALYLLLEERHVTRAAARLGVTQSTMSHRLAKLRDALDDDLLVPQGSEFLRSARAEAMKAPLAAAIAALAQAIEPPAPFEPARDVIACTLAIPDLLATYLPKLLARLHTEAPRLELKVVGVPSPLSDALAQDCDLAVAPRSLAEPQLRSQALGKLEFGVVFRREHPLATCQLTLKRWLAYPHVVVSIGSPHSNLISAELSRLGKKRRVGLTVPGFLAGLLAVRDSDLLMNAPLPLATHTADSLGLIARPLPLRVPKVPLGLMWHPRKRTVPAHAWLRAQVYDFFHESLARC